MLLSLFLIFVAFTERTTFSAELPSYNLDIFVCRTDAILSVEAPAGYVMFDYSARKDCSLQIQVPRGNLGSRFLFNFESLRVGTREEEGCGQEELRIYNGPTASGGSYLSVCGESQEQVLSTGNTVTFRLVAQGDVQEGRFIILYTIVHEAENGECPQHSYPCLDAGCLSQDVYGDGNCNCPDGSDESDTDICGTIQDALPRAPSSGWTQYQQVLNTPTLSSDAFNGDATIPAVLDDVYDDKESTQLDQHRNETSGAKEKEAPPGESSPPLPEPNPVSPIAAAVGGCLAAGSVAAVALILWWLKFKLKSQSRVGSSV
ncbi:uncharacterized protein [Branchiostoma lanceolatum]|uniref:uncharacterized protein n=1 Tax=Branchiostoma lanceolatum TaxID=7740 RepID=UPI003454F7B0